MNYVFYLLIYFEIYAIVAMSLNLLIGYSGLLQVAHAAYYGIGAYTAVLLWMHLGWGFFPGLAVAALTAGLLSLLVSLPAWRFKGDYFVMISIAVQTLLYTALYNWTEPTNGPFGITGISRPVIIDYSIWGALYPAGPTQRHVGGGVLPRSVPQDVRRYPCRLAPLRHCASMASPFRCGAACRVVWG